MVERFHRPALLSWIINSPLRFHTVTPGVLMEGDLPVFVKLMEVCAPTLLETPLVNMRDGFSRLMVKKAADEWTSDPSTR